MKKILIIEDEAPVREILKDLLSEQGYLTITATDGVEGIRQARETLPDLIISDIMMPEANGYYVKEELEKNECTKYIPFVFLTAKTDINEIRKGMELGVDDYIPKPFKAMSLLKAIDVRLRKTEALKTHFQSEKDNKAVNKNKYDLKDHIFIDCSNKPQFIKIMDIATITAENEYSEVVTLNGSRFLIRKTLSKWESILPECSFLRVHRSTIINLNHIEKMEKHSSRSIKIWLKNMKTEVMVSQRYAVKLRAQMQP